MLPVSRLRVPLLLLAVLVLAVAAAAAEELKDPAKSEVVPRKKHGLFWRHALYAALPWLFAAKVKIVIVTVVVTLVLIKLFVPFAFAGSGFTQAYSAGPEWSKAGEEWPEYPGGSTSRQLLNDVTHRVMQGLAAAELSWRAVTEREGTPGGCRARLACELQHEARDSQIAARMVAAIRPSLLNEEAVSSRVEDCSSLQCKLYMGDSLSSSPTVAESTATEQPQVASTTEQQPIS